MRLALAVLCFAACSTVPATPEPAVGQGPGTVEEAAVVEPEPETPRDESAAPVVVAGDPSSLDIPHDMPPLDTPCDTRREFARGQIAGALEYAGADCAADSDCVPVSKSTGCRGACRTTVLATHAEAYEALRSSVDDRVCSTYRDDGCPYATPRCANLEPKCVEGRCEMSR